ncbi:GDCCVxC domain-containing (seleno)protein [Rhodoferax bucti]|nr:GDCCVxC domain-containing (seleno)protein [Rhodoferax bucti]
MPTDACQFFYECSKRKSTLHPKPGCCCVYWATLRNNAHAPW